MSGPSSINFLCGKCDARQARETGEPAQPCENCGAPIDVTAPPPDSLIDRCAACGHAELFVQRDFNRTTGILIIAVGAVFVPWTWGLSLLAVTILDYIVWRKVKDVIVCYACQAVHRGYPSNPTIKQFDLVTHDRHVYGAAPPGAEEGHHE